MVWRMMLICLFLLMSVSFTGAQNNSQSKFIVRCVVNANEEGIKSEVASYLKRELRSLGDVVITEDIWNYDYKLDIIILHPKYKSSGTKAEQISCAYLGIKRFRVSDLASKLPREHFDTVFGATWQLYSYPELFILEVGRERTELKQLCQEIVAEFDTKLLEPDR